MGEFLASIVKWLAASPCNPEDLPFVVRGLILSLGFGIPLYSSMLLADFPGFTTKRNNNRRRRQALLAIMKSDKFVFGTILSVNVLLFLAALSVAVIVVVYDTDCRPRPVDQMTVNCSGHAICIFDDRGRPKGWYDAGPPRPLPGGIGTESQVHAETSKGQLSGYVFVIYGGGTFWTLNKAEFADTGAVDSFFESEAFRDRVARAKALVCVGLASYLDKRLASQSDDYDVEKKEFMLSQERAGALCHTVSTKIGNQRVVPPIYFFGLGRNFETTTTMQEDDAQRRLVIIGVTGAKGDMMQDGPRREMIGQVLFGGHNLGFFPREYYVVKKKQDLCWHQLGLVVDANRDCSDVEGYRPGEQGQLMEPTVH